MSKNTLIVLIIVLVLVIIFWSTVKVKLINVGLLPTANVNRVYDKLSKLEGGQSNNSADSGGYTNRGVTIGTWQTLAPKLFGIQGTTDSLARMTQQQWERVVEYYWDTVHASDFHNQGVAELMFDSYFNSGWYGPQKMVIAFNNKYGTKFNTDVRSTILPRQFIDAVNSKNGYEVCQLFWNARKAHYEAIVNADPSQRTIQDERVFLKGWLNRLNEYKCTPTII